MRNNRGFTLVELLLTLVLVGLIGRFSVYMASDFLPQQTLVALTNRTLGLLQHARARALNAGPVLVCDRASRCRGFSGHPLVAVADRNGNDRWDRDEDVIGRLGADEKARFVMRTFGSPDFLGFSARGITNFQNGSLYVCYAGRARRIIITWAGEARIEPGPADPAKCRTD